MYAHITHKSSEEFHPTQLRVVLSDNRRSRSYHSRNRKNPLTRMPRINLTFVGQEWRSFFHGSFVRHGEPFAEVAAAASTETNGASKGSVSDFGSRFHGVQRVSAGGCRVRNNESTIVASRVVALLVRGAFLAVDEADAAWSRRQERTGEYWNRQASFLGFKGSFTLERVAWEILVFLPFFFVYRGWASRGWMGKLCSFIGRIKHSWIFLRFNLCTFQSFLHK